MLTTLSTKRRLTWQTVLCCMVRLNLDSKSISSVVILLSLNRCVCADREANQVVVGRSKQPSQNTQKWTDRLTLMTSLEDMRAYSSTTMTHASRNISFFIQVILMPFENAGTGPRDYSQGLSLLFDKLQYTHMHTYIHTYILNGDFCLCTNVYSS